MVKPQVLSSTKRTDASHDISQWAKADSRRRWGRVDQTGISVHAASPCIRIQLYGAKAKDMVIKDRRLRCRDCKCHEKTRRSRQRWTPRTF